MKDQTDSAQQFAQRCEQLRQNVRRLENSFSVPTVSPLPKLDASELGKSAASAGRVDAQAELLERQSAQAAASAEAFLERLRPQYAERMEIRRREEAKRTAVALLREQERKKEETLRREQAEQERARAELAAQQEAQRRAAEEKAAREREAREEQVWQQQRRLQNFYAELDAFAQPLERVQAYPEQPSGMANPSVWH